MKKGLSLFFSELVDAYINDALIDYAKHIKFAWESDQAPNVLENVISSSKTIVLIGYSLPLYNRLVDLKYLKSSLLQNKLLVIQDLNPKGIAEILESDFNIDLLSNRHKQSPTLKLIENCNSFFVPSSIFR